MGQPWATRQVHDVVEHGDSDVLVVDAAQCTHDEGLRLVQEDKSDDVAEVELVLVEDDAARLTAVVALQAEQALVFWAPSHMDWVDLMGDTSVENVLHSRCVAWLEICLIGRLKEEGMDLDDDNSEVRTDIPAVDIGNTVVEGQECQLVTEATAVGDSQHNDHGHDLVVAGTESMVDKVLVLEVRLDRVFHHFLEVVIWSLPECCELRLQVYQDTCPSAAEYCVALGRWTAVGASDHRPLLCSS
jgi:hypothetical protein